MLKRLIEVALPLKEVSEQSAREKSIRHGHISTLHIWWARRPLAACRAVVFASLIPDPDDPECPDSFPTLVNDLLPAPPLHRQDAGATQDTPRNRCLEFIKHLVRWENSNNEELIGKARKLIAAAHKFLHPDADGDMPNVLDPFAGGGAIPLEALRLGCEAHAIDLNPVAHLIELCTLVYPQKYGQPNSRPTPGYIKKLEAAYEGKDGDGLFSHLGRTGVSPVGEGVPPVKDEKWTRRHLPHWQREGATYFVTWRCAESLTLTEADRDIVLSAIRHWDNDRWKLYAAVVMPDHVHVLAQPLRKGDGCWDLGEILHSVKSFSAHEINKQRGRTGVSPVRVPRRAGRPSRQPRKGSVWQDERFDRIVRDEAEFIEKWEYIAKNPIKTGLADTVDDYRWLYLLEEIPNNDRPEAKKVGQPSRLSAEEDGRDARPTSNDIEIEGITLTRLPLITESEYQKNPLAADVKFWGHWVLEKARDEIGQFYPPDPDGSISVAYLWARTVKCPNPACGATIPTVRQLWLCKKRKRKVALRMIAESDSGECRFEVAQEREIEFDPDVGTVQRGNGTCPFCQQTANVEYMRQECRAGRMSQQMIAVVTIRPGQRGKCYREATQADEQTFANAAVILAGAKREFGADIVPQEALPPVGTLGFRVNNYGLLKWGDLFNSRQALALTTFVRHVVSTIGHLKPHESGYASAVSTLVACGADKCLDFASTLCRWGNDDEGVTGTFGRQALPMVWDYAESNFLQSRTGSLSWALGFTTKVIQELAPSSTRHATVVQGDATKTPYQDKHFDLALTDPPYYDAVPYADLSDFFYVWAKRSVGTLHPMLFRTPLTPKQQELVSHLPNNARGQRMNAAEYEDGMGRAFSDTHRVLRDDGLGCVMFAHKTTAAWEAMIASLNKSGLAVTASWPIHTEGRGRLRSHDSAALASSVTLVCRKRPETAGDGYWDDVRDELRQVAHERLDFFWQQGIRGADFFISAIGPALSVYGRYAKVTRLTGEEVSVGQFLDEVRRLVTDYALSQILAADGRDARPTKVGQASRLSVGQIDSETRFYVLWKWSYGGGKVAADEAFKLSQALGIDTEEMWDRTGVLEKQGQNVQALTVAKRMRIKDLGEPLGGVEQASGLSDGRDARPTHLPTVIDTLHRCCAFRDKGDTGGLSEYLARSGHGRNEKLWTVAQAISEVLPDGDKEKQLLQGLLNQRDKIDEALKQGELF